jgi:hypothetical protein
VRRGTIINCAMVSENALRTIQAIFNIVINGPGYYENGGGGSSVLLIILD